MLQKVKVVTEKGIIRHCREAIENGLKVGIYLDKVEKRVISELMPSTSCPCSHNEYVFMHTCEFLSEIPLARDMRAQGEYLLKQLTLF